MKILSFFLLLIAVCFNRVSFGMADTDLAPRVLAKSEPRNYMSPQEYAEFREALALAKANSGPDYLTIAKILAISTTVSAAGTEYLYDNELRRYTSDGVTGARAAKVSKRVAQAGAIRMFGVITSAILVIIDAVRSSRADKSSILESSMPNRLTYVMDQILTGLTGSKETGAATFEQEVIQNPLILAGMSPEEGYRLLLRHSQLMNSMRRLYDHLHSIGSDLHSIGSLSQQTHRP